MPNNTTNISVPLKGMNTDVHPINLGEQGYDYALNTVVEEFTGNGFPILQNESSNIRCTNFPSGFKVIGVANVIEQNRKILFLVNPTTGFSQIGEIIGKNEHCKDKLIDRGNISYCDTCEAAYSPEAIPLEDQVLPNCCTYTPIVISDCLGFDINNPINSVYRLEDCQLSLFFTDNRTPYRYLEFYYIDDDPSKGLIIRDKFREIIGFDPENCDVPIYGEIDCNKVLLDPVLDIPCINLVDVLQGGSLKAGVYEFLFAYSDISGNKRTPYFPATNPIPIYTREITFETNYNTDRSIQITVNNISIDSPYEYYNIAVAKTIDNVTSFELVGTFPIGQKTVTYSGNEKSLIDLTPNDIFEQKVYYGQAKYVGTSNELLFWAGLTETKKLNVQRVSNNVKLYWQTVMIPEPVYKSARFNNKFKGYLRDEVYAFGLVLIYDNGEESVVGHIPGPSKDYFLDEYAINVDTIINNADVISDPTCANDSRNKLWQVYNTAQLIFTNPSLSPSGNCDDDRCFQYGDFSYWESIEHYPNEPEIWADLCGEPIRHHKFPDALVTHIHDGLSDDKTFTDGNLVFPIGVRVDHQSVLDAIATAVTEGVLTQEDVDRIKGYRIVRGNRFGNKSIVAKGLLFDVWNYIKDDITYYYPNYPYNDLRDDVFLTEDKDTYDDHDDREGPDLPFRKTGRYTFDSPDTHFVSPELGEEIKLETDEYGESEGYFSYAEEQAKQKMLSTTSYLIALAGGIVAMLTLTEPVKCIDYTIKSDVIITQDDSDVSSATFNSGQNITGAGTTTITTVNAGGSIGSHTISNPDITQDHSTGTSGAFYDPDTGVNIGTAIGLGGDQWSEKKVTTCQGKSFQYFNNPTLSGLYGAFLFLQNLIYKIGLALQETQIVVDLIKSMVPKLNYGVQYNSVGKYNNYLTVANSGFKRRKIESYSYLKPENALIDEAITNFGTGLTNIHFNNWHRESSIYLRTDSTKTLFNNPAVVDNSRFKIDCRGSSSCDFSDNYNKIRFYRDISSYYAAVKRYIADQYGTIPNIEYIDTGNCIFLLDEDYTDCEPVIFGGDTFINRFALKRKQSFFLQTRFRDNDETDVKYSDLGNVAYPRYYYDTTTGVAQELEAGEGLLDIITDPGTALGRPKSYLDAKTDKFFYQNGVIYLYNYGIPYFLVESDINVDYRYGENVKEKNFYPHITDLDFWLQEQNVPPSEDNYYFYNSTYSKQNKEHAYSQYPARFEPGRMCRIAHPNRIIQSFGPNWLNYKANDFGDFTLTNGVIVGVDGIENEKLLVRYENTFNILNAYDTIQTNAATIEVSNGGIFKSRPQEYAHTTLGYGGCQHNAILHTEFGHIWVDAKRGNIFNLNGATLDEISKDGMKNWFKENLPFQILKDLPNMMEDIDNNYKGVGIALAFDKRFSRFILTKLDYKSLNTSIVFDIETKKFMLGATEVFLNDTRYFCNKSWTISYNLYLKAWTSFHSYIPNYYVDSIDYFVSGVNAESPSGTTSSMWIHNFTNKSYQVFYNTLYPFIVQTITKPSIDKNNLNSVEYELDAIRYHSEFDPFYTIDVTFNKAIVFTQNQNSGLLNLEYNTKNDLSKLISYPITNANSTTIRVTNADGIWRFNQFYDLVPSRSSNIPIWLNNCANSFKGLNPQAINYQTPSLDQRRIRGEYCRVRLINDTHSNYKFLFKYLVNHSVKTFR